MNKGASTGLTSTDIKLLVIIGGIVLVMLAVVVVIWLWMRLSAKEKEHKKSRWLAIAYRMMSNFPLTKGYVRNCYTRLKRMSVQTELMLRRDVTVTALKGVTVCIVVSVGGMFLIKDLVCRVMLIVLGVMMANRMVVRRTNNINMQILNKMSGYIGLVREEYLRTESIIESLQHAEAPAVLKLSIEQILDLLSSTDVEGELAKFIERTPCDFVKTFAIACVRINDMGEEFEENKEPTFIRVLKYLEEDVNAELERRYYIKSKFGLLEWTSLIPMLATDLLPSILSGAMPGLNVVYEGMSGYIFKVLLVLSSVMGYYLISMLSQLDGVTEDDRNPRWEEMAHGGLIAEIAEKASPKGKARRKVQLLLDESLSKKSMRALTIERMAIAVFAFACTILVGFASGAAQKKYAETSTNTFGMIASNDTEAWSKEYILNVDNGIFAVMRERAAGDTSKKAADLMSNEEVHAMVSQGFSGLTELQISDQVARIQKKYDLINSGFFHWWFILVAAAVAGVAFFVPIWLLKFRLWNIHKQEQEEFLALQTLCTIIAISDSDVLDALEGMYKMAKLYKERLLRCYLNYCIDPKKELARLESKMQLVDFKRLIKKLELAVDDVSLKEAFEGMDIERKHIVAMREQQSRTVVNDRRNKAGMISKISMGILVAGMLVYPVIYVGFTELVKVFDSLQSL